MYLINLLKKILPSKIKFYIKWNLNFLNFFYLNFKNHKTSQNPNPKIKKVIDKLINNNLKSIKYLNNQKLEDYFNAQKNKIDFLILVKIINGKLFVKPFFYKFHPRFYSLFINLFGNVENINVFYGLFYLGDDFKKTLKYPIFVYSKNKFQKNQILIPDSEAYGYNSELHTSLLLKSKKIKFENLLDKAFWRGATSGGDYSKKNWKNIHRAKLVNLSINYPEIIDAKFSFLCQGAKINRNQFTNDFISSHVSPHNSTKYKFLIDVDGNSCSWARLRWLMFSGSVILKHRSNNIQWYYPLLKKNYHFIEISLSKKQFLIHLESCKKDNKKYIKIKNNSQKFANDFFDKNVSTYYLKKIISKVSI